MIGEAWRFVAWRVRPPKGLGLDYISLDYTQHALHNLHQR